MTWAIGGTALLFGYAIADLRVTTPEGPVDHFGVAKIVPVAENALVAYAGSVRVGLDIAERTRKAINQSKEQHGVAPFADILVQTAADRYVQRYDDDERAGGLDMLAIVVGRQPTDDQTISLPRPSAYVLQMPIPSGEPRMEVVEVSDRRTFSIGTGADLVALEHALSETAEEYRQVLDKGAGRFGVRQPSIAKFIEAALQAVVRELVPEDGTVGPLLVSMTVDEVGHQYHTNNDHSELPPVLGTWAEVEEALSNPTAVRRSTPEPPAPTTLDKVISDRERLDALVSDDPGYTVLGMAIVKAAIDCHRAGLGRPIPAAVLKRLCRHYMPQRREGDPDDLFESALQWAAHPFAQPFSWATYSNAHSTALLHASGDTLATLAYAPDPWLVDHIEKRNITINDDTVRFVIDELADGDELLAVARIAAKRSTELVDRALRRADNEGSAVGAYHLGMFLTGMADFNEDLAARLRSQGGPAFDVAHQVLELRTEADAALARARERMPDHEWHEPPLWPPQD
jgi:hypothetical protein